MCDKAANPLEQFVLLAKTAKGAAAVELIKQALEAPGVYVFGELLDMPNVQELENTPNSPHLTLLNMFAYGNYSTLVDQKDNTPELTDVMTRKLRLLTIVSRVNLSQSTVCLRSAWRRQARCCRTASCRRSWASPPLGTWRTSSLRCISYL